MGPQSAEDLTGETFLVAFRKRGKYDMSRPNALRAALEEHPDD